MKFRVGLRCLKGMGYINFLIEEFNLVLKEYEDKMYMKLKKLGRNEFLMVFKRVFNKFIVNDWDRMYLLIVN